MSLFNSYQIGVSGMSATSKKMSSVTDNIANSGVNGFKKSSAEFSEALSQSMSEHSSPTSTMAGVGAGSTKINYGQGDIAKSGAATDMAINGDGFFKVKTKFGNAYTRDGSFNFNKEGVLVTGDGHELQGFKVGADGKPTKAQGAIKLNELKRPGTATSKVDMILNLDPRETNKVFDANNPEETSSFSQTIQVYDNEGKQRYVKVFFTKTADNTWQYNSMIEGEDYPNGEKGKYYPGGSGTLTFDDTGKLLSEVATATSYTFKDTGAQEMELNFGESLGEGGDGAQASTQFGTAMAVSKFSANGNKEATLSSLGFGPNGMLQAFYTNGEVKDVAQVAIAKFDNNQGLKKIGSNLYLESSKSGQAGVGAPGEGGRGEVISQSIELSNVDIANEFVDLMTTQKSFAASAKTMSATDELIKNVINIKG